ncbi:4-hydroxy-tetrahydrodipicolinate synthase [Caulobacter sp. KR2-114]|uniref:4-hydroxy-tetrahydrodipicolinate synthase n=1 Tax=Caulobacter sp. KR2-114 TaxID=3400912 RepID=UPI003BFE9C2C
MTDCLSCGRFGGLWLPLVTPFRDDRLDEASLRRLVRTYAGAVDGLVLGATTGEGLALSPDELRRVLQAAADERAASGASTPILVGLAGAVTAQVIAALRAAEAWPGDGFLVSCPSYVRPSQDGLRRHFEAIADSTRRPVLVYNIPYRTGVNMANDTLIALAERPNIVGVKDCCADPAQTLDLIARRPPGFAVLAGDDASLLDAVSAGADGGITASAHLDPAGFSRLLALAADGRGDEAKALWRDRLAAIPALLFAEPNPAPLKYALWRRGLIDTPDLRLPMTPVSDALARRLDQALAAWGGGAQPSRIDSSTSPPNGTDR